MLCYMNIVFTICYMFSLKCSIEFAVPKTLTEIIALNSCLRQYLNSNYLYILALFSSVYIFKQTFCIPGSIILVNIIFVLFIVILMVIQTSFIERNGWIAVRFQYWISISMHTIEYWCLSMLSFVQTMWYRDCNNEIFTKTVNFV